MQDQHLFLFDTTEDDVLAHGEAPHTGPQILIAAAAKMRVQSKQIKASGQVPIKRSATSTLLLPVAT